MLFKQFDPRPQGAESNEEIFRQQCGVCSHSSGEVDGLNCPRCFATGYAPVYGIEVTIPALASRCYANLDHHGPESTAETPSACEQALVLSSHELPFENWVLATVRPDADSVTAMAVIVNRQEGKVIDAELVSAIGCFDRLGPASGKPSPLVSAIARKACDFKLGLDARVLWVSEVLAGDGKEAEVAELISAHDRELIDARKASTVEVYTGIFCQNCGGSTNWRPGRGCGFCNTCGSSDIYVASVEIATVVSTHRFATNLGYEVAPVVVAMNPEMPVDPKDSSKGTYAKFTVCRYDSHVPCDLPSALVDLQVMEPGWGGRGDIFGSPQGVSSSLTLEQVVDVIKRHIK
jgi:hypothetical protein